MSWITARRRHPAAGYAVLLLALVLIGAAYAAFAGHGTTASAAANSPAATKQQLAYGRQLFEVTCATCHGIDAQGSARGPSLIGVGAAAVDFQISTGRMPAKEIGAQMQEKRPVMNRTQTLAVANYIALDKELGDPAATKRTLGKTLDMLSEAVDLIESGTPEAARDFWRGYLARGTRVLAGSGRADQAIAL